jgi:hypothetical protein
MYNSAARWCEVYEDARLLIVRFTTAQSEAFTTPNPSTHCLSQVTIYNLEILHFTPPNHQPCPPF